MHTNWYVITGAPSSGKTTILSSLDQDGFQVINDLARDIISQNRKSSDQERQEKILQHCKRVYAELDPSKQLIFEYGMPDNLVYQQLKEITLEETAELIAKYRYRKIILLEPLEFEKDGIRDEYITYQQTIHKKIYEKYCALRYQPIVIPKLGRQERLNLVKQHLSDYGI